MAERILESDKKYSRLICNFLEDGLIPWKSQMHKPLAHPVIYNGTELDYANQIILSLVKVQKQYDDRRWLTRQDIIDNHFLISEKPESIKLHFNIIRNKETGVLLHHEDYFKQIKAGNINAADYECKVQTMTYYNADFIFGIEREDFFKYRFKKTPFDFTCSEFLDNITLGYKEYNSIDFNSAKERTELLYRILSNDRLDDPVAMLKADIAYSLLSNKVEFNDFGYNHDMANPFIIEWNEMLKEDPSLFSKVCIAAENEVNHLIELAIDESLSYDEEDELEM